MFLELLMAECGTIICTENFNGELPRQYNLAEIRITFDLRNRFAAENVRSLVGARDVYMYMYGYGGNITRQMAYQKEKYGRE